MGWMGLWLDPWISNFGGVAEARGPTTNREAKASVETETEWWWWRVRGAGSASTHTPLGGRRGPMRGAGLAGVPCVIPCLMRWTACEGSHRASADWSETWELQHVRPLTCGKPGSFAALQHRDNGPSTTKLGEEWHCTIPRKPIGPTNDHLELRCGLSAPRLPPGLDRASLRQVEEPRPTHPKESRSRASGRRWSRQPESGMPVGTHVQVFRSTHGHQRELAQRASLPLPRYTQTTVRDPHYDESMEAAATSALSHVCASQAVGQIPVGPTCYLSLRSCRPRLSHGERRRRRRGRPQSRMMILSSSRHDHICEI